jgi:hypothetical protein
MLKRRTILLCVWLPLFLLEGCAAAPISRPNSTTQDPLIRSLIRVNVTRQNYNFHQPWQQGSPSSHTGIGVVMEGPHILLTSQMMANHRYVELEKLVTGEKGRAEVEVIDYEANLALLRPLDTDFLKDMRPLDFSIDAVEGDLLTVLQVKRNGNIVPSEGPITAIELLRYPSGSAFLAYRLNSSLQFRLNNFTLPVLKNGRLAGLLMGYDSKGQSVDIVAAPVIEHFLEEASDGDYQGFPNFGLKVVSMDDPQLRRYVGIPEDLDGLYIQRIQRGLGAEKAGLREGDIIIEIAGFTPDRNGDYEHPVYGKVSVSYLIRCESYAGDRVQLKIFREGEVLEKEIIPEYIPSEDDPVPPFLADSPPRYFILGGLVLQELSLPYLREYGSDWSVKAPISLVHYQKNQYTLDLGEREKIVLLSKVLQTSRGMGYESLRDLVIIRINNQPIRRLGDVPKALKFPIDGFHKIEFEDPPRAIYVDPEELAGINQEIRQRYGLPALHNLDAH